MYKVKIKTNHLKYWEEEVSKWDLSNHTMCSYWRSPLLIKFVIERKTIGNKKHLGESNWIGS